LKKFPSHPGFSLFLVDAKTKEDLPELRRRLEAVGADVGARVDLTRDVLSAFHQIENTYIAIFNVLGTLGVVLGSLGLAIVVARNLRERRGEFAVMTAIGIPRRVLGRMVFAEFGRLVIWGVLIGAVTSAIAVWPNLAGLPPTPTLILVVTMLAGIVGLNFVCGWLIFRWTVRQAASRES
jgi:ABC-type antimicrobial peptide transport system permease subunit